MCEAPGPDPERPRREYPTLWPARRPAPLVRAPAETYRSARRLVLWYIGTSRQGSACIPRQRSVPLLRRSEPPGRWPARAVGPLRSLWGSSLSGSPASGRQRWSHGVRGAVADFNQRAMWISLVLFFAAFHQTADCWASVVDQKIGLDSHLPSHVRCESVKRQRTTWKMLQSPLRMLRRPVLSAQLLNEDTDLLGRRQAFKGAVC